MQYAEEGTCLTGFMDIQGTFDSITFAAIQEALKSCETGRIMTRWIVSMLTSRNIHMSYKGESEEVRLRRVAHKARYYHPSYGEYDGRQLALKTERHRL